MGTQRVKSPLVRVIRDGHDPLEVQTANPDLILWDRTRIKHKWPGFQEAPFLWLTFISWGAARRTGAIPSDYKYETWEAEVLDVQGVDDDDDDEIGNPTHPGAEPG